MLSWSQRHGLTGRPQSQWLLRWVNKVLLRSGQPGTINDRQDHRPAPNPTNPTSQAQPLLSFQTRGHQHWERPDT